MAKRGRRSYPRSPNQGYERARAHIEAGQQFSKEMGGTDKIVKNYFFNLDGGKRYHLFNAYGHKYGAEARTYAEGTFAKWRSGHTQMSGMVATRLFDLLPPMMPLADKFDLSAKLWDFVAPKGQHTFVVGPDANVEELGERIRAHVNGLDALHHFPETMQKRFDWLAQGDIEVQKQLRAYLRDRERKLMLELCGQELPIFIKEIGRGDGLARSITHTLKFKNYQCHVRFLPRQKGIVEKPGNYAPPPANSFSWGGLVLFIILAWIIMSVFMSGNHHH